MATETAPDREIRTPLSRERVLRAAIELADANGIKSLTMRRLARELGVEAMTLYYYLANKDELLNGIVDIVVSEIELPPPDTDWKQALRQIAISEYHVLLRHKWVAGLMLHSGPQQARLRNMDAILGALRRGGFSAEMTHHAYHALEGHIVGFTLWIVGMDLDPEQLPAMAAAFLEQLPRDELPFLAEHIETHMHPMVEYTGSEFEFGLDLILDGLDRMLDGDRPQTGLSDGAQRP
jgi:AcrR family transcriptional regulator